MKRLILDSVKEIPGPPAEECTVSLGVFDGMHQGHLMVLHLMQEMAMRLNTQRTVVTFSRHPDELLTQRHPGMILSMEHRLRLLERNGIDLAVVIPFDEDVRKTSAHDFLTQFLIGALRARAVILGYDSAFGRDREGNLAFLQEHAPSLDIEVLAASEVSVGGKAISSTRIREAIRSGDLRLAEEMLGREVSILGQVVHGDGRGRQLGFPTANVDPQTEVIPPAGVYEVTVLFRGIRKRAVLSIGTKPTFHGSHEAQTTIEVHIPGFSGDLYGEYLEVFVVRKIRDQKKFDSVEELLRNIRKDIGSLGLPAPRNGADAL
jgi:riboflavin kinase/FMN adenylyltransferase